MRFEGRCTDGENGDVGRPADPRPRQPDRVDAERQRREQRSELERGACSRAKTDVIKDRRVGRYSRGAGNEDRRTQAGKKDAVARFWRLPRGR